MSSIPTKSLKIGSIKRVYGFNNFTGSVVSNLVQKRRPSFEVLFTKSRSCVGRLLFFHWPVRFNSIQKLSKHICGSRGLKIRNAAELCCVIKTITALATIFEAVDDSQYFKSHRWITPKNLKESVVGKPSDSISRSWSFKDTFQRRKTRVDAFPFSSLEKQTFDKLDYSRILQGKLPGTAFPAKRAATTNSCSGFNLNLLSLARFKSLKALANISSSATIVGWLIFYEIVQLTILIVSCSVSIS